MWEWLQSLLMQCKVTNGKAVEPWLLLNTVATGESSMAMKHMITRNPLGMHGGLGIRFGITFRIEQ